MFLYQIVITIIDENKIKNKEKSSKMTGELEPFQGSISNLVPVRNGANSLRTVRKNLLTMFAPRCTFVAIAPQGT